MIFVILFHMIWNFRSPRQAGNHELNSRFEEGLFSDLTPIEQNKIRLNYLEQYTKAVDKGATVSEKDTRFMALKALSFETGRRIPGVN